jgi:hypothetical protein
MAAWPNSKDRTPGRPPTVDRDLFVTMVLEELRDEGDIASFQPGWQTYADILRKVRPKFEARGHQIGDTLAKELVKDARQKYLAAKAAN